MGVGELISLSDFLQSGARKLLCYPAVSLDEGRRRELLTLGVTGIYNFGPKQIAQWHCLGLGYCGLVLLVRWHDRLAALKIRRMDAPQESFELEAKGLAQANEVQVGPRIFAFTTNFLVMDYATGQPLSEWLSVKPTRSDALDIMRHVLAQAFRLDQVGMDHGNLRCVTHHVVVSDRKQPMLLDFSSVSFQRRAANVTTLAQGLFWGTVIARQLKALGISPHKDSCIQQLRSYKQKPTSNNFEALLEVVF
ncbi:MAG: hypothetical protein AB8B99_25170 [Phormidesmis sp.]